MGSQQYDFKSQGEFVYLIDSQISQQTCKREIDTLNKIHNIFYKIGLQ